MIAIALFLLLVILFDLVALRWGVDSTEGINSSEWERRRMHGYRIL